jgi:hypothetical protein
LFLFGFEAEFRYSVEQRNLSRLTGKINVRAAELQRKSVDRPAVGASRCSHVVGNDGDAERASKSLKIVDPD